MWAGEKKKYKFISGEAGVISAGVCWLIDPAPITVLREAGRPRVRQGSERLTMAQEIWVRAATSPRRPFGNQRSSCAPWLKHSPAKFPFQGSLLHPPPSLSLKWGGEGRDCQHIQHCDDISEEQNPNQMKKFHLHNCFEEYGVRFVQAESVSSQRDLARSALGF